MTPIRNRQYAELLRRARSLSKHADDAEDLLQAVLLTAVEAGRVDLNRDENRRWLAGVLRKRALFDARTAVRRRNRESLYATVDDSTDEPPISAAEFVRLLPRSLRTTALLALTGHSRAEIRWLLNVSDTALRQRVAQIKKRWRVFDGSEIVRCSELSGNLAFGSIRKSLLKPVRRTGVTLASHDADGHLFAISSQNRLSRQQQDVLTKNKERRRV